MTGPTAMVGSAIALAVSLLATGPMPAAPPPGVECGWRITASHVLAELRGDTSPRAEELRTALTEVGAGEPGFVPAECYEAPAAGATEPGQGTAPAPTAPDSTAPDSTAPDRDRPDDSGSDDSGSGSDDSGSGDSGDSGNSGDSGGSGNAPDSSNSGRATDPAAPAAPGGATGADGQCTTTAANRYGWGAPSQEDGFDGSSVSENWNMYDGPGHGGNGVRTPDAISVADGQLTITGSENGDAGGMAWTGSQQFGRWEGCVRSPAPAADSLHTLLLLWPSEENWPVGGEVDFMEISDGARQKVDGFLHYGEDNSQTQGSVDVDASQWHAYAVEWSADQITYFVDGEPWFTDSEPSHNPPGPMHLTIQLDYFGGDASGGAEMNVDWVRQWPMEGAAVDATVGADGAGVSLDANAGTSGTSSDSDSGDSADSRDSGDSGGSRDSGDGSREGSGDRSDGGSRGGSDGGGERADS
ncbi:glycoside hydrolase family 16 protein [Pseudonocardia sp. HH130630-07]|uniref:glycoside hydrolase family 16 protein n=1 Tax=Pseudonocardia sp. HH130630-07 TaxID=1690815 RepID=UPI000814F31A|nr:glycoside hydrolase family 16 protein [Pseudonocardia sp. HH130630-07]ANY07707.1 hypothetical protein AFB00_17005 [Pseudonocardia sp. HH130630-07]